MSDTINDPELKAMSRILSVVGRDADGTPETPIGESLRRLAKKGDMEAALVLEEIDSPMACIRDALLDEALKFDPSWSKLPDGSYRCRQGGAHKTPEALVAAFVDAAGDDLWAVISDETREKIGREALRMELTEALEEKVAVGELRRVVNDDGDLAYQKMGV